MKTSCFMDEFPIKFGQCGSLYIGPNQYPIAALHLLLPTKIRRETLEQFDLLSAVSFVRAHPYYFVFHNMRGSGASEPQHLHFQALVRDGLLPIEEAPRRIVTELDGATVMRVEDYPVFALAVCGPRAVSRTFQILQLLAPTPFNLVLTHEGSIVIPRSKEHSAAMDTRLGALEMVGWPVLSETQFQSMSGNAIWETLAQCGWSKRQGEAFEIRMTRVLSLPPLPSRLQPGTPHSQSSTPVSQKLECAAPTDDDAPARGKPPIGLPVDPSRSLKYECELMEILRDFLRRAKRDASNLPKLSAWLDERPELLTYLSTMMQIDVDGGVRALPLSAWVAATTVRRLREALLHEFEDCILLGRERDRLLSQVARGIPDRRLMTELAAMKEVPDVHQMLVAHLVFSGVSVNKAAERLLSSESTVERLLAQIDMRLDYRWLSGFGERSGPEECAQ